MKNEFIEVINGKPRALNKNAVIHIYYIEQILGHRYVADRKITIDGNFYILKQMDEKEVLITVNIDKDYPYTIRGFVDKNVAKEYLKGIEHEQT